MENKVIRAFQRAAASVPAYKKILSEKGIQPEQITALEQFEKNVPVLYKEDLFKNYSPRDLCVPGSIDSLATAIVTSGTSGSFAYKIITKEEQAVEKQTLDNAFNLIFNQSKLKTCIINMLAMGVSFASSYPVIPTSVRSDIAWHVIKSFSQDFEQIIIITDPNFAKKFIEEARRDGLEKISDKLKFIIGGDWSPVSYFDYIKQVLASKNKDNIFSTFGTTEIGLNLGMADNSIFELRKALQNNKNLQKDIFGEELSSIPTLLIFDTERTCVEKINKESTFSELAFTTLLDLSMPFIRYSTGDCGTLLSPEKINKELERNGLQNLALKSPAPILAISGRISNKITNKNNSISAEDIKQIIFSDSKIAENVTGDFRLYPYKSSFKVDIQLMDGAKTSNIQGLIKKSAKNMGKIISVKIYDYHKFPYNMVLDYESKWKYIKK